MTDAVEMCGNPADEVYATMDDFGPVTIEATEPFGDELPFHIPRD